MRCSVGVPSRGARTLNPNVRVAKALDRGEADQPVRLLFPQVPLIVVDGSFTDAEESRHPSAGESFGAHAGDPTHAFFLREPRCDDFVAVQVVTDLGVASDACRYHRDVQDLVQFDQHASVGLDARGIHFVDKLLDTVTYRRRRTRRRAI